MSDVNIQSTDPADPNRALWGAPKIAPHLGLTVQALRHKVRVGLLDGVVTFVGGQMMSTPRKCQQFLDGTVSVERKVYVPKKPLSEAEKARRRNVRARNRATAKAPRVQHQAAGA